MTSKFINSHTSLNTSLPARRQQLKEWFQQCRDSTLATFAGIDDASFRCQVHPDFSPAGWHLGHIADTEALWILERCAGLAPLFPQYRRLFAADGLPKSDRVNLPTLPEILDYLDIVREKVFNYLEIAPLDEQERLWRFILQHESQHCETITFVLQLQQAFTPQPLLIGKESIPLSEEMVKIPAGEFEQGNNSLDALDNERLAHKVYLDTYWLDRYPVTCKQYREFMVAGGYQNSTWWSREGWEWLQTNPVTQPLYWQDDSVWDNHPVCGVSWYEAEAYACFVGKRLPTEAEWETAASWDAINSCRRTYPWGEEVPSPHQCNYSYSTRDSLSVISHQSTVNSHQSQSKIQNPKSKILYQSPVNRQPSTFTTAPVNAYPAGQSSYGCYDMLGNVWEWTASWFDGYAGFESYPYIGYSKVYFDGQHRVLKGGSWATRPWALRCSFRNWYHPYIRQIFAGFRCAKDD